jgi:hypothetical protein
MKRMKGLCSLAVVTAAIVLAVPAVAAADSYTGTFTNGGTVSFNSKMLLGKAVKVSGFTWKSVPLTCDQGKSTYSGKLPFSLSVARGAFSIQAPSVGLIQSVSGQFTNHTRNVSGLLNVYGNVDATHTNCHTGKLHWTATR